MRSERWEGDDSQMLQPEVSFDSVSLADGGAELKALFSEAAEKDINSAVAALNEETLKFEHIFVLKPIIEALDIFNALNLRNRIALCITDEILTDRKNLPSIDVPASTYVHEIRSALKWMLTTGFAHDGLSGDFDRVLDACAALLVKAYGDKTVLPIMAEAIFRRNREGFYYNDLVWAFFESRYPYGLILIANRLQSGHYEDVELAARLLGFIPPANSARSSDKGKKYLNVLRWIEENTPFLYYTGESFQQTGSPKPYRVMLGAKYLCKTVAVDTGRTLEPLTDRERKLIAVFKELDYPVRVILAEYSLKLHNYNIYLWNAWMQSPVAEQVKAAALWAGGGVL